MVAANSGNILSRRDLQNSSPHPLVCLRFLTRTGGTILSTFHRCQLRSVGWGGRIGKAEIAAWLELHSKGNKLLVVANYLPILINYGWHKASAASATSRPFLPGAASWWGRVSSCPKAVEWSSSVEYCGWGAFHRAPRRNPLLPGDSSGPAPLRHSILVAVPLMESLPFGKNFAYSDRRDCLLERLLCTSEDARTPLFW